MAYDGYSSPFVSYPASQGLWRNTNADRIQSIRRSFPTKILLPAATGSEFKRFVHDLPISARCVSINAPGLKIHVKDTSFQYFASCKPYKASTVGTAVNDIEAPIVMDSRGNIGHVTTRVLHYRYNCDKDYQNCRDEEQFFLGRGYGLWKWEHFKAGVMVKTSVMNDITSGSTKAGLSCTESYQ